MINKNKNPKRAKKLVMNIEALSILFSDDSETTIPGFHKLSLDRFNSPQVILQTAINRIIDSHKEYLPKATKEQLENFTNSISSIVYTFENEDDNIEDECHIVTFSINGEYLIVGNRGPSTDEEHHQYGAKLYPITKGSHDKINELIKSKTYNDDIFEDLLKENLIIHNPIILSMSPQFYGGCSFLSTLANLKGTLFTSLLQNKSTKNHKELINLTNNFHKAICNLFYELAFKKLSTECIELVKTNQKYTTSKSIRKIIALAFIKLSHRNISISDEAFKLLDIFDINDKYLERTHINYIKRKIIIANEHLRHGFKDIDFVKEAQKQYKRLNDIKEFKVMLFDKYIASLNKAINNYKNYFKSSQKLDTLHSLIKAILDEKKHIINKK